MTKQTEYQHGDCKVGKSGTEAWWVEYPDGTVVQAPTEDIARQISAWHGEDEACKRASLEGTIR